MLLKDFGATALIATPSYAMYLAETAKKMGVLDDLKVRLVCMGAEASTAEMHESLQKILGAFPTENYGLTEVGGPGVAGECREKAGMHINEDMFYPEIVDVEHNKVLNEGEQGEMLITTLTKEGMPILRYRTKDITSLTYEPCKCGRTLARMSRVVGRTDDMLIIRGEALVAKIKHALRVVLQIDVKVKLVEPFSIKRAEGKVKRVTDLRKK